MIEFTSIIRMSEKQTPLSLDWANKNFELTYQDYLHKDYVIDVTKDCRLSWYINDDGSSYWELKICFATFNVKYTEEVEYLLRTFYVNDCNRKRVIE